MTNIIESKIWTDEGWDTITYDIMQDGEKAGYVSMIIPPEDHDDQNVYLENIEVFEDYRNKGIGTEVIRMMAKKYGFIYFAASDENNQRLYERIAHEGPATLGEVDQGFGIYYMEG